MGERLKQKFNFAEFPQGEKNLPKTFKYFFKSELIFCLIFNGQITQNGLNYD